MQKETVTMLNLRSIEIISPFKKHRLRDYFYNLKNLSNIFKKWFSPFILKILIMIKCTENPIIIFWPEKKASDFSLYLL